MVIELGPPMSVSSTKISKFHALTDSEHKFHKVKIKNWLPIGFQVGVPLLGTRCSTNNGGVSKHFIYQSIQSWDKPGGVSLPGNCASVLKSHSHHPEWHCPPIEQKPTTIGLVI